MVAEAGILEQVQRCVLHHILMRGGVKLKGPEQGQELGATMRIHSSRARDASGVQWNAGSGGGGGACACSPMERCRSAMVSSESVWYGVACSSALIWFTSLFPCGRRAMQKGGPIKEGSGRPAMPKAKREAPFGLDTPQQPGRQLGRRAGRQAGRRAPFVRKMNDAHVPGLFKWNDL